MGKCHYCGAPLEAPIYRSSECTQCGKDTKICLNCTFYSETSHWECRESIGEAVREKDRSNYCDFFRIANSGNGDVKKEDNASDAFNKLFGD